MCYVINSSSHSYLISQINRVLQEGKITAIEEKYFLDAMLCYQPITQEELTGITEIFSRLQSGKLKLIEENY